jgi:hypothetical protein
MYQKNCQKQIIFFSQGLPPLNPCKPSTWEVIRTSQTLFYPISMYNTWDQIFKEYNTHPTWGIAMKSKYLGRLHNEEWFQLPRKYSINSLIIWKEMVESFPLVFNWTVCRIGNGNKVRIGENPWAGANVDFRLFDDLMTFLYG